MLSVIPWRFRAETTLNLSKGERSCTKALTNRADSCRWRPLAKASKDFAIALR